MIFGNGRPVFSGIAIGKSYVYKKQLATLPVSCGDPAVEQQKFETAKQTALEQLQTLMQDAAERLGEEQAMILDVQMMMLDDLDYLESIEAMIQNGASAAQAVKETGDTFAAAFSATPQWMTLICRRVQPMYRIFPPVLLPSCATAK